MSDTYKQYKITGINTKNTSILSKYSTMEPPTEIVENRCINIGTKFLILVCILIARKGTIPP